MQKTIISAKKNWLNIDFKELWLYRELIYFFAWRNIKLRYKQTLLGIFWVVFQPLITMVIFSIFFGKFAKIPSNDIPYPIFVYAGLVLWNYFSFSVMHASESMVENEAIIKKVYFPKLIVPISSSIVGLIDLFIACLILFVLMIFYKYIPGIQCLIYLPVFIIISFFASMGIGSFLASLNVKYRDVKYVLPFFIQILMFLTPVIYPSAIVKGNFKLLLYLNPMTGVIENTRNVLFGASSINWMSLFFSIIITVIIFVLGILYFRKTERFFADII